MDPITAIATCVNSTIKIFEVTYQLKGVDEQTADLISTANHINLNINEARRLRQAKILHLSLTERAWIDRIISDTEEALRNIAELIEPARVDKTTTSRQSIEFRNKVLWVFRDNPKVRDKHARLIVCHQSLTAIIACLHGKGAENQAPEEREEGKEQPPPYDPELQDFFEWNNQKRRRKSSSNTKTEGGSTNPAMACAASSTTTVTNLSSPISFLSPILLGNESSWSLPIIPNSKANTSTNSLPLIIAEPFEVSFASVSGLAASKDTLVQVEEPLPSPSILDLPELGADESENINADLRPQDDESQETRSMRNCNVGFSGVRRGQRSWLAYHVSREDV